MRQSGALKQIKQQAEMKYRAKFYVEMDILRQMCIDSAFMAANDVFQMGPGRCEQFGQAMTDYLMEMADMMNEDGKTDKDLTYTCEKVDKRLKKICGEKFQPWEERYGK